MSDISQGKKKPRKAGSKVSQLRDTAMLVSATLAGILSARSTDASDKPAAELHDGLRPELSEAATVTMELSQPSAVAENVPEPGSPARDDIAATEAETRLLLAKGDTQSPADKGSDDQAFDLSASAAGTAAADTETMALDEAELHAESSAESVAAAEVDPSAEAATEATTEATAEAATEAGAQAGQTAEAAAANGSAGASTGAMGAAGAAGAAGGVSSGLVAAVAALPLAASGGGGGGDAAKVPITASTTGQEGTDPQGSVYTIAQLQALEPETPAKPFQIKDTADNLFAKMIQSHAATYFAQASGVSAKDAPTLTQALVLAAFDTTFLETELADGGIVSVAWSDVLTLKDAGLHFGTNADVTLVLAPELLDDAIDQASMLRQFGVRHFDVDGAQASISNAEAASLLQIGIDFVDADHIVMEVSGTQLETSLDDLQALGVDVIVGAQAQNSPLEVSVSSIDGEALPQIAAAFATTLTLKPGQLSQAVANAQVLHDAGIDQISSPELVTLSSSDAASLIDAGLSFSTEDTVHLHAAGTELQTTLDELQDLGVDVVTSSKPTVVLQQGDEVNGSGQVTSFAEELDVTLQIMPSQMDSVLAQPALVAASNIDHLSVGGGSAGSLSDKDGSVLLAALQAAGIDEVRIEPAATVTVTDDQAAQLLLAGKLSADAQADITVEHAVVASDPEPDKLDVTLAQLAEIGVDHVDTVLGGSVMVDVGVAVDNANLNQELQALLAHFADGQPLFNAAQVTLNVGAVDVNQVNSANVAELKLLGVDYLVGADGDGNALTRELT